MMKKDLVDIHSSASRFHVSVYKLERKEEARGSFKIEANIFIFLISNTCIDAPNTVAINELAR